MDAIDRNNFKDFEDCLQDKCAKEAGAEFIVTCNLKDFEDSEIPAITPADVLEMVNRT